MPPGAAAQSAAVAANEGRDASRTPSSFNDRVLELARAYPKGGGYAWPAPKGTHGTTRDLVIDGERIARASPNGTHCSGLTFEVFWRALEELPGGPAGVGLTPERATKLLRTWFVPKDRGKGPAEALPAFGLGARIRDLDDARPGDFLQVWMNNGRGHTAIFLGWIRDEAGHIVASRHWSTHPVTGGIGIEERAIGDGPRDIDPDAIYIARAAPPAP